MIRTPTVVLAGGTGSSKLLRGLKLEGADFSVIANVGDNFWVHGLYSCPDLDIATYTLAGVADTAKGWGIRDDTFNAQSFLSKFGRETWFNLGDMDLATHVFRTGELRSGKRLTEIAEAIALGLGVTQPILPPTDDPIETHIVTERLGEIHLQEFWVKNKGEPDVLEVKYSGADIANPTSEVLDAIRNAERIVFCPANPMTSILPTLTISGIRTVLGQSRARRIAVSPLIGASSVSGPAAKLIRARGLESNSTAVARLYKGLIDCLIIDESDSMQIKEIEGYGIECITSQIYMKNEEDESRVARLILEAVNDRN